uniref:Linker for activation of T-cells family member 1 n=1 Tax=Jaculus jaculus TaxID=51337 RepID=A0A8C5L387_JACJA
MEADTLPPLALGLLLLPLATLLVALCVRCRELPTSYDSASAESSYPRSILFKPPLTSFLPLSQPDLLPIPRSPQPPRGSHRMPSSRQDSDSANSVASYENQEPA